MANGTEIERKFLLDGIPSAARDAPAEPLRQGYLALDGDTEVRIRLSPGGAKLTIKAGRGAVRVEQEISLQSGQGEALWPLTAGRRVEKTRRRLSLPGGDALVAEIDEYAGALAGLVVVEVEFPDEPASDGFEPPAWFGRELTGDGRYANRSLATDGLPAS